MGVRERMVVGVVLIAAITSACSDGGDRASASDRSSAASTTTVTPVTPAGQLGYASSEWVTLHGDPRNADRAATDLADAYERDWSVLDGASVLLAPSLSPAGDLYVTTGLAAGASNLHAVAPDGTIRWESEPWSGPDDLDSCAVLQTPIIDTSGDVYLSDCNQLWSFYPDGSVKWVVELPAAPAGSPFQDGAVPFNPFVTAFFTHGGVVGGITVFGQVVVVSRDDGSASAPVLDLPGGLAPEVSDPPLPPTLWDGGYMDPFLRRPIWNLLFGGIFVAANTPAVDPPTGRIFITGTGADPGTGAMYGIDFIPGTRGDGSLDLAFATPIGPGSGSSPAISPDGSTAYGSDEDGILYAIQTDSGSLEWQVATHAGAASPTIGADGRIYLLQTPGAAIAVDPDGTVAWTADLSDAAAERLPVSEKLGAPVGLGDGVLTVTNHSVLVPVVFGYPFHVAGRAPTIPIVQAVVALDPATGELDRTVYEMGGTSEGMVVPSSGGPVYFTRGAILSTSLTPLLDQIVPMLPDGLEVLPARGGLEAARPSA